MTYIPDAPRQDGAPLFDLDSDLLKMTPEQRAEYAAKVIFEVALLFDTGFGGNFSNCEPPLDTMFYDLGGNPDQQ